MGIGNAADVTLNNLMFDGGAVHIDIANAITSAEITRTLDGAPLLTIGVEDPRHTLLTSGIFAAERKTAQVDGKSFELAGMRKQKQKIILTFEDLAVAEMRKHKEPKGPFKDITRVEFARMLMAETPWIPFYVAPGVNPTVVKVDLARGIVASDSSGSTDPAYDTAAGGGAAVGSKTAIPATEVAKYAAAAGFSGQDLVIAVAVASAESGLIPGRRNDESGHPINYDGSVDFGLWQINDKAHRDLFKKYKWDDPAQNAKMAYEIYKGRGNKFTAWVTYTTSKANLTYKRFMGSAQTAVNAMGSAATAGGALNKSQQARATKAAVNDDAEDTWTCLKRIFGAVQWRVYVDWNEANVASVYVGPDAAFLGGPVPFQITEQTPFVHSIDWDFDVTKNAATATVEAEIRRWQAPPGTPVDLLETGLPNPWLVKTVTRDFFRTVSRIDLTRPQPELPEPEPVNAEDILAGLGLDGGTSPTGDTTGGGGSGDYVWPVSGAHNLTTKFGQKSAGTGRPHQGIDIAVPQGTPIYAARDGVVNIANGTYNPGGYGNLVTIKHRAAGTDKTVGPVAMTEETYYAHLSEIRCRNGLSVSRGQLIGLSGGKKGAPGSGDSTGPHLHFEIRKNGNPVDPLPLLSSTGKTAGPVTETGPLGPQGIQTKNGAVGDTGPLGPQGIQR